MSDLFASVLRRDDGIARAEAHAAPPFNAVALDLLREYAESHDQIFVDDFLSAMRERLPETHELRALGAVYQKAARLGWIVKSGQYRLSNSSNRSPKPVWVSLIFTHGGTK